MNIDCRVIGDLLPPHADETKAARTRAALSWTIISKPAPAAAKRSRG